MNGPADALRLHARYDRFLEEEHGPTALGEWLRLFWRAHRFQMERWLGVEA